ncbi:hypothetical protein H072_5786 [Dactylellina haptotyla CBS 200.50]|uniref:Uncharacterized protein n=1 Tax=Dactylellina haptotyla (strain CBS 200.50) TaxID=1284197 RepID=S8BLU5_DACHA|nr:hypothetical protein H072_5786 [Dactylellina haptotyla CBS 200.50]
MASSVAPGTTVTTASATTASAKREREQIYVQYGDITPQIIENIRQVAIVAERKYSGILNYTCDAQLLTETNPPDSNFLGSNTTLYWPHGILACKDGYSIRVIYKVNFRNWPVPCDDILFMFKNMLASLRRDPGVKRLPEKRFNHTIIQSGALVMAETYYDDSPELSVQVTNERVGNECPDMNRFVKLVDVRARYTLNPTRIYEILGYPTSLVTSVRGNSTSLVTPIWRNSTSTVTSGRGNSTTSCTEGVWPCKLHPRPTSTTATASATTTMTGIQRREAMIDVETPPSIPPPKTLQLFRPQAEN